MSFSITFLLSLRRALRLAASEASWAREAAPGGSVCRPASCGEQVASPRGPWRGLCDPLVLTVLPASSSCCGGISADILRRQLLLPGALPSRGADSRGHALPSPQGSTADSTGTTAGYAGNRCPWLAASKHPSGGGGGCARNIKSAITWNRNPVPSLPQPLVNAHLLPVAIGLPALDISSEWNHTIFVLGVLPLGFVIPRFTHVVLCVRTAFLFMDEYYSVVWIHSIVSILCVVYCLSILSVDGHLGCSTLLASVHRCKWLEVEKTTPRPFVSRRSPQPQPP